MMCPHCGHDMAEERDEDMPMDEGKEDVLAQVMDELMGLAPSSEVSAPDKALAVKIAVKPKKDK